MGSNFKTSNIKLKCYCVFRSLYQRSPFGIDTFILHDTSLWTTNKKYFFICAHKEWGQIFNLTA